MGCPSATEPRPKLQRPALRWWGNPYTFAYPAFPLTCSSPCVGLAFVCNVFLHPQVTSIWYCLDVLFACGRGWGLVPTCFSNNEGFTPIWGQRIIQWVKWSINESEGAYFERKQKYDMGWWLMADGWCRLVSQGMRRNPSQIFTRIISTN
jgi:hypothetical protein